MKNGDLYKYHLLSQNSGYEVDKGDPFSFCWEISPKTASRVWDLEYGWNDEEWMKNRHRSNGLKSPMSVYEVHLGSWKRDARDGYRFLTYRELATALTGYVKEM